MVNRGFNIKKESGETQAFSRIKFINSLKRSGLNEKLAEQILKTLRPKFNEGITTRRLYRMAHKLIRQNSQKAAVRYALPRALLSLGPSGHNFERFMGELMNRLGYDVEVGYIMKGCCVNHEVDVIATKPGHKILMECKFHNDPGYKEDVKTALYVDARRLDLAKNHKFDEFWLVTNSRFTSDALEYSACSGLITVSPHAEKGKSLYDLVNKASAHPIGCLSGLRKQDQSFLIDNNILFVKDLIKRPKILNKMGLKENRADLILKEARIICSPF